MVQDKTKASLSFIWFQNPWKLHKPYSHVGKSECVYQSTFFRETERIGEKERGREEGFLFVCLYFFFVMWLQVCVENKCRRGRERMGWEKLSVKGSSKTGKIRWRCCCFQEQNLSSQGKPNLEGSWESYLSGWDGEFWDEKHLGAPGAGGPASHNYSAYKESAWGHLWSQLQSSSSQSEN